ncbi:MAG: hypothetical protein WA631_12285 [Nitrososphaeraceae archaeon]
MKILARPIYLILAILMLTLATGNYAAQAQTTSGIDWPSLCNTVAPALVQPCSAYVNPDGTFTPEGERAFGCIRNGVLMAGAAMALGVPAPLIIPGLKTLASQTGCDNIINWDLLTLTDLKSLQSVLPH